MVNLLHLHASQSLPYRPWWRKSKFTAVRLSCALTPVRFSCAGVRSPPFSSGFSCVLTAVRSNRALTAVRSSCALTAVRSNRALTAVRSSCVLTAVRFSCVATWANNYICGHFENLLLMEMITHVTAFCGLSSAPE